MTKIDTTGQPDHVVALIELYEALDAVNLAADKARRGPIGVLDDPDELSYEILGTIGNEAWRFSKIVMVMARAKAIRTEEDTDDQTNA